MEVENHILSHPTQKIIESYGGGEKPDVQIVGYYNQRWAGFIWEFMPSLGWNYAESSAGRLF